jgi:HSP20 family protein
MADEQLDPMKELNRLRNTVGKVIEQGINTVQGAVQSAAAVGAVRLDVYELKNEVVIRTNALDGLVAESIEVAMEGAELTIKGVTEAEEMPAEASYFLQERRFGPFERTVTIPIPVRSEEAKAKLGKNGILTVTLPIDKGKYQDIAVTPDE